MHQPDLDLQSTSHRHCMRRAAGGGKGQAQAPKKEKTLSDLRRQHFSPHSFAYSGGLHSVIVGTRMGDLLVDTIVRHCGSQTRKRHRRSVHPRSQLRLVVHHLHSLLLMGMALTELRNHRSTVGANGKLERHHHLRHLGRLHHSLQELALLVFVTN